MSFKEKLFKCPYCGLDKYVFWINSFGIEMCPMCTEEAGLIRVLYLVNDYDSLTEKLKQFIAKKAVEAL